MNTLSLRITGALLLWGSLHQTGYSQSSFTGLGFLPGDSESHVSAISADGKVAVGRSMQQYHDATSRAFRWTPADGMKSLGFLPKHGRSTAHAISADGLVIVGESGTSDDTVHSQAFRWTEAKGMNGLGFFPGGNHSAARGVSADGNVVVGESTNATCSEAFRWTSAGGMIGLGYLPECDNSHARGVSDDGSVVVGTCESRQNFNRHGRQAFCWGAGRGMTKLGDWCEAKAVSGDGHSVVGDIREKAFRWNASTGQMEDLSPFKEEPDAREAGIMRRLFTGSCMWCCAYPEAVSRDGSVVVGWMILSLGSPQHTDRDGVFVWDSRHGARDLRAVLASGYKLDLGQWELTGVTGVSADGTVLVGEGVHNGRHEAWIARLHRPLCATKGELKRP